MCRSCAKRSFADPPVAAAGAQPATPRSDRLLGPVLGRWLLGAALMGMTAAGAAEPAASPASVSAGPSAGGASQVAAEAPASSPRLMLRWAKAPRVGGRITSRSLGVVINQDDPYSVEVGERYVQRRQIPPEHVLRLRLSRQPRLTAAEGAELRSAIDRHFGDAVQGLALVWRQPYAVECQSITAVVSLGLEPSLCANTCAKVTPSRYFNAPSAAPWRDLGLRPSMLLAAGSVEAAQALIDRGIAADGSLGLRGSMPVHAYFMVTRDAVRNVRLPLYPPPGLLRSVAVATQIQQGELPAGDDRLLLVQTGVPTLSGLDRLNWVPGAMADHLTSFGGQLTGGSGQTSALAWIDGGTTASYGSVSEPCNHPQKFPHPQLALLHYLQGSSVLEAYWKSVQWPQLGVFVGEPLAAPFARP